MFYNKNIYHQEALKAIQQIEKMSLVADDVKPEKEGDQKEEEVVISSTSPEFIKNSRLVTEMKVT